MAEDSLFRVEPIGGALGAPRMEMIYRERDRAPVDHVSDLTIVQRELQVEIDALREDVAELRARVVVLEQRWWERAWQWLRAVYADVRTRVAG